MKKNCLPLSASEHLRYARHLVLPEVGMEGQHRLKQARVLCVGAGGLGSPALFYLAAAGVGTIGIMDDDVVDHSNLQRQILFSTAQVGEKKVVAARDRLLALNSQIDILALDHRLTEINALETIRGYDLVLDCTDLFSSRYLINDACATLKLPHVYASILRFEGQCSIFSAPEGPCYRCLYPSAPNALSSPSCVDAGVLGALSGILGSIQAMEAMKLILQKGTPLIGRLLVIDALNMTNREFSIPKNQNCPLCVQKKAFVDLDRPNTGCSVDSLSNQISVHAVKQLKDNAEDFVLLDVREPFEYEICNIGGYLIPFAQLAARLSELDPKRHIIILCKVGGRSQKAAEILNSHGFEKVSVLGGGILAWIEAIDSSLTRY